MDQRWTASNSVEGHVQIKECITEKQLKKLIELVWLWGKISIQNLLSEKGLEFFCFTLQMSHIYKSSVMQFIFNYKMEPTHHNIYVQKKSCLNCTEINILFWNYKIG